MGKVLHVLPRRETTVRGKLSISRDYVIADPRLPSIFKIHIIIIPFNYATTTTIINLFFIAYTVSAHCFSLSVIKLKKPMDLLLLPNLKTFPFLLLSGSKSQPKTVSKHISRFPWYFYRFSFPCQLFPLTTDLSLSTERSSVILINPDVQEAVDMHSW